MQTMRSTFSPGTVKSLLHAPEQTFNVQLGSILALEPQGNAFDPYMEMHRYAAYYMNYLNIVKVEVLTGYKLNGLGEPMINKPIWKLLNNNTLEDKKNNSHLFCRLVRYSNPFIENNEHPELLQLPIIDEYFIIENEDVQTRDVDYSTLQDLNSRTLSVLIDQEKTTRFLDTENTRSVPVNSNAFTRAGKKVSLPADRGRSRSFDRSRMPNGAAGTNMSRGGTTRSTGPTGRGGGY